MHWMNPYGAWALISLLAILCLYILKQRMEPIEISSTYLWRKALASMEADRPFQKLRRNILLFLQLLLALLLALSIMRPMTLGGETGEVIFVFDLSASMQAEGGDGSRLDVAKEDAVRRIEGLPDGARVSVLTAGSQVAQPLARSGDLIKARRTVEDISAQNGGADMDGALSLALALERELEDVQVIVYSDQTMPEDAGVSQPSIGQGLANCAVLSVNATDTAAVARVVNYGGAVDATVECYADGELVDVRTVSLEACEVASVQFELPKPAGEVRARIDEPDALPLDNERIWVARDTQSTTVVLAGRDNIFVEKALSLRPDISVLKTTVGEAAAIERGSLTVMDGPLPGIMPENGALLLIDPDRYVGALQETTVSLAAASSPLADVLNEYLQVEEIQVARWRPVQGGTPIWEANGQSVLSILEEDGRTIAVLGFDVHDSNLPLLKEFPLFMQGLLAYLVPEPLGTGFDGGECGDALSITPYAFARSAEVITPSGRHVPVAVTGENFTDTGEIGVYQLVQTDDDGEESVIPFALHVPVAESDLREVAQGSEETVGAGQGAVYGREWTPWLIGLLLAVMLLEWGVYRRGY